MSNVRLELRLVNSSSDGVESRLLWEWRNDPVTRKMSREPAEVSWENHKNWFLQTAQDPKKIIFIAYDDSTPVGMIRFDWIDNESAEININLSPVMRGKGLGRSLLKIACNYAFEILCLQRLYAEIKPDNFQSIRIFENEGFSLSGMRDGLCAYYREKK